MQIRILRYDTIDSTNSEAMRQAKLGAPEGLCIVADEQTAGRGRHGRTWESEKGSGLYFSMVLRPKLPSDLLPLVTLMSAVAVREALLKHSVSADIKWVNDLLVGEKKISGILCEAVETVNGPAVIVGIGINLEAKHRSDGLSTTATSVEEETKTKPDGETLLDDLVEALKSNYEILNEQDGPRSVRDRWTKASSYASGKSVLVRTAGEQLEGITRGIEGNGGLRVELPDGSIRIVQAGDVERLRRK